MGKPSQNYGMGCHRSMVLTILLTARHKRAHPALIPAGEGLYSIYLPRRDGKLSWPRCVITPGPGIEHMTARSEIRRPTAAPPRHYHWWAIGLQAALLHCVLADTEYVLTQQWQSTAAEALTSKSGFRPMTHGPETGAINRLHFSGADFWYVCHTYFGPDSSGIRFWRRLEHCFIPSQIVACTWLTWWWLVIDQW